MTASMKYGLIALVVVLSIAALRYGPRLWTNRGDVSIEGIITQLKSADPEKRKAALEKLEARAKPGLAKDDGLTALHAATGSFPPLQYEWQDAAAELVNAAATAPYAEYVPIVGANFAAYNTKTKTRALALLARLPDRVAAETYVALVKAHARSGALSGLPKGTYADEPRHAEVLFPALLDFADVPALQWDIYLLCLNYLGQGALKPPAMSDHADHIVNTYREYKAKLKPLQRREGIAWMWKEEYQPLRSTAALLLDILGYVPGSAAKAELHDAVRYDDPRLAFFAARSLLRHGEQVPERELTRIAAWAETRNLLFDGLQELGRPDLFPRAYATQAALAESDMVGWLTFPTELARVPDEIELMKVVSEDVGGEEGILDFYLFRFRTDPPHWAAKDGWMAGVAGPFRRADAPSTASYGHTFSTFDRWDDKRPEEHVEEMKSVLREWVEKTES